jgi:hypothetical protein
MIARKTNWWACCKCDHRKHARACKDCACQYRSAPRKPIKARNEKRRPAALATAQRETVIERSGGCCEFERMTPNGWERCGDPGRDTAHALRRHLCTGLSIYDADVALFGCRLCHESYDSRQFAAWVRVPEAMLARAIACVKAVEVEREVNLRAVVPLPGESA